jgi:hypothetical protein
MIKLALPQFSRFWSNRVIRYLRWKPLSQRDSWRLERRVRGLARSIFPFEGRMAVALVEVNKIQTQEIPLAFFSNALAGVFGAKLVGIRFGARPSTSLRRVLNRCFLRGDWVVDPTLKRYRAFGCSSFVHPEVRLTRRHWDDAHRAFYSQPLTSARDVEAMVYKGIPVGDLIYDDFLVRGGRATLEPADPELHRHIVEQFAYCAFLVDYFSSHKVVAYIGNHVYRQGLVARIANWNNVESYEVGLRRIARVSKHMPVHSESRDYARLFETSFRTMPAGTIQAIQAELFGSLARVDSTNYHLKNPAGKRYERPSRAQDSSFSILIALHCLSDSPHVRGVGYFTDYLSWVQHTINLAHRLGYQVLLKPHPACPASFDPELFQDPSGIVETLPSDFSLDQLVESGLGAVVTYYGNIAFESALRGVPAVCAHPNNPFRAFGFAFTPESLEDYDELLRRLPELSYKASRDELTRYFWVSRFYFPERIFFEELNKLLREGSGTSGLSSALKERFQSTRNEEDCKNILLSMRNFIQSCDQVFGAHHLKRDCK